MATPEAQAKKEVKEVLSRLGCTEHFAPKGGAFGAIGVADRVACVNGRYVAIECKAGANKLSPMQAHRLRSTAKNGGVAVAYWAGNATRLESFIRDAASWPEELGGSVYAIKDNVRWELTAEVAKQFIKEVK